jgi:hypothetical protein
MRSYCTSSPNLPRYIHLSRQAEAAHVHIEISQPGHHLNEAESTLLSSVGSGKPTITCPRLSASQLGAQLGECHVRAQVLRPHALSNTSPFGKQIRVQQRGISETVSGVLSQYVSTQSPSTPEIHAALTLTQCSLRLQMGHRRLAVVSTGHQARP